MEVTMQRVEEAARLMYREMHTTGYSNSWEQATPSQRQEYRHTAGVILKAIGEGLI